MTHLHTSRRHKKLRKFKPYILKNLSNSLLDYGRITTTVAKAKALQIFIERLITKGKKGGVAATRAIVAKLGSSKLAKLTDICSRMQLRCGGYTRVFRTHQRCTDAAIMAEISLVD